MEKNCAEHLKGPRHRPRCDPEFGKNPYGKEECFSRVVDAHEMSGTLIEKETEDRRPNDDCVLTTQAYFTSKVAE